LLPFERHHAVVMRHDRFQQSLITRIPDYLDRLEAQSAAGAGFTILENGRVMAIFGVTPVIPLVYEAWMLRDRDIAERGRPTAVVSRRFFEALPSALVLRRCQITVECSNLGAVRFAEWLDFEIEGRMRSFGRTDSYMMGKIYGRST
jgi:RimJ/RimL family protein N-acetyltransferase